jgi:23S rRNA (cytidine1920-2'-O)/16S rRNA (cytidine1409-2'-O)-methyltransferase
MARRGRSKLRKLARVLEQRYPEMDDPTAAILGGRIVVEGRVVQNPDSLVRLDASIVIDVPRPLRGEAKLRAALEAFDLEVSDRVALDVGAAAGGFTRVLLEAGLRRVYAVDVGFGQLLGSLRQDPRVVTLERTNIADLTTELVPESVDVVTLDLSYLALGSAVAQLNGRIAIAPDADLVGLVKPQFELGAATVPVASADLREARETAVGQIEGAGWSVVGTITSPVRGTRGSTEFLVYARRRLTSSVHVL